MADNRHNFPIVKMSEVFKVSRSGYYRWLGRGPSKRAVENKRLKKRIKEIWEESGKTYGSPRIHQQLLAEEEKTSRPRVARLMKAEGIQSQIRRKWVQTTDASHSYPKAPNLLAREFNPDRLGQAWVSDITFILSEEGWLYLTTVMDLADRQIIGWSLSKGMKALETIIPAWKAACERRPIWRQLLFHSDQGIQYACREFTQLLKANPLITQSMSRKGNCWDNAPAESFFKTFKAELGVDTTHLNYKQVRQAVFHFIEIWYNRKRLHSTLDYKTPAEMEQYLTQQQELAA